MAESEEEERRERSRLESNAEADGRTATGEPIPVEDADHFAELVTSNPLVLVDFYADWCSPCKMLEPTVEELARTTDAVVARVDVDVEQLLASRYSVSGVPTLLLFSDGDPVERVVGVREADSLPALIAEHAA